MKCNIIRDLIPLYIDGCCSEESADTVREHLSHCDECESLYEDMKKETVPTVGYTSKKRIHRIDMWKASLLQSVLLFVSFALIAVGVAFEAGIPSGFMNGNWAFALVVPITGFMLSLVNWYFIRLYKSRKCFSDFSALITFFMIIAAAAFTLMHYEINLFALFNGCSIQDFFETLLSPIFPFMMTFVISAAVCMASKLLSDRYAKLLGKE